MDVDVEAGSSIHPMLFMDSIIARDYYILSPEGLLDVDCAITRDRTTFRLRWEGQQDQGGCEGSGQLA